MRHFLNRIRFKYLLMLLPFILLGTLLFLVLQTSGTRLNTFFFIRALNQFENVYVDLKIRLKPITLPQSPLVIVAFDERTLEAIGQWPPHRKRVARLLESIFQDEPQVVALDIVFSEDERQFFTLAELEKKLEADELAYDKDTIQKFLRAQAPSLSGDLALEKVLEHHANKIVLGYHWYGQDILSEIEYPNMVKHKEAMAFSQIERVVGLDYAQLKFPLWHVYAQLNQNIQRLTDVAEHFGFFNAVSDIDGIYRRSLLMSSFQNPDKTLTFFPSLALQMAKLTHPDQPAFELTVAPLGGGIYGADTLTWGPSQQKLIRDGTQFLNFLGPSRTFPHISARELILGEPAVHLSQINPDTGKIRVTSIPRQQFFKDKVVLIGVTASGVFDLRPTPNDRLYTGVELHATTYENFIHNSFLKNRPDLGLPLSGAWLLIFFLFSAILLHLSATTGALFSLLSIGFLVGLDYRFLFLSHHTLMVMAVPIATLMSLYAGSTFILYLFEGREKRFLRSAFQKYVSQSVVNEIVNNPQALKLGGTKKEVSILFSDIRDFTSISEQMESQKLSHLLSDYLTPMTHIVFNHQGTLDKYIGDALMAFWNAPINDPHHATHAIEAALDMLTSLHELNRRWQQEKQYPPLRIGIGINTGIVSVGNMGSESIFDYTVIGDAVNLGSRTESLTKTYGAQLLITEFTAKQVDLSQVIARPVDKVAVKGKKQGVLLYQIFGRPQDPYLQNPKALQEASKYYESALRAYFARQWNPAKTDLQKSLKAFPQDTASHLLLERIETFQHNPGSLPPDWDGTFIATEK